MLDLPRIYPITDTRMSGLSHLDQVKRLAAGGAVLIQLREKWAAPVAIFFVRLRGLCNFRGRGVKIIINDRVDIALALNADGVHLGQDDLPPAEARKLLGPNAIIGFSTHSIEQAMAAISLPVDYVAIGPIFPTSTKETPDEVVGIDGIKRIRNAIGEFPFAAIGGINRDNLTAVLDAGADSAAVISALVADAANMMDEMSHFKSLAG